jgi:Tfp pilus assembly protein PilV
MQVIIKSKLDGRRSAARRGPARLCGVSLIEVLISLSLVAALSLEIARLQVSQLQSQRDIDLRLAATTLLDSMAEMRRMGQRDYADVSSTKTAAGGTAKNASIIPRGKSAVGTAPAWQARAAALLPDGRIDVQPIDRNVERLLVSWQHDPRSHRRAGTAGQSAGALCGFVGADRSCVAVLVPVQVALSRAGDTE